MPRYFSSLGTGRPLVVGGRSFIFEPVEPMGGSWAGVLAVDDPSAASILADAGLEITEARYNELKKKAAGRTTPGFVPSPMPQLQPQPLEAPANRAGGHTDSNSERTATPDNAVPPTASVTLATTSKLPPAEPLFEAEPVKRRKAA